MAIQHEVAGPVLVKFNSASLGYTRDGAQIRIEPRWIDVPSDDYGGASGAPADAQLVGAICTVHCDLTKYDKAEVHKLSAFQKAGTAGTLPVYGSLMRQGSLYATLLLDGVNEDWTFSVAIIRMAQEVNKGTRFSTFVCGFECWVDAAATRVLFTIA